MTLKYTCDICGRELEGDTEDGLLQLAKTHLKQDHALLRETDVSEPNLAYEDSALKERFEETD